jgi:hypothetical protein
MRENDSCGKVIYMGDVQRPEEVNDSYVKQCMRERWIEVSLFMKELE